MTREEARELISKHSYKDELGIYVISKKIAFIIADCLENEALQNRSCKNCKFGMKYHFDDEIECVKIEAETEGMYFSKDFYCNKWEKNEN